MIVIARDIALSTPSADDIGGEPRTADNPLIGYRNIVTSGGLSSSYADAAHPVTELANPATHLYWQGSPAASQTVDLNGLADDVDYVGIARHNLGSAGIPVSIEGAPTSAATRTKILLQLDGADASTTFTDEAGHAWTPYGAAAISTAQSVFGGASMFCDASSGIRADDDPAFTLDVLDFTIDGWFYIYPTDTGLALRTFAGQVDAAGLANVNTAWFIEREDTTNKMRAGVLVGTTAHVVTSARSFTGSLSPGWHHLAFIRSGSTLRLFVDGQLEGSAAITGAVNNSSAKVGVGSFGDFTGFEWLGWIDQFRMTVGEAIWTADFSPPPLPQTAASQAWRVLVDTVILLDDEPVLFQFTKTQVSAVRIVLGLATEAPRIAVMYAGELLVLQRRIYVGHTPVTYGRATDVLQGRSQSGDFLGAIVLSEARRGGFSIQNMTPLWYRTQFDPFVEAGRTLPFFFAWRPGTYPREVGFCWLTNDPTPKNQRPNGMMQIDVSFGAIAS